MTTPEFLDLVHHYLLTEPEWTEEQRKLNRLMSGPRTHVEKDKPLMTTEAAKAIPVPSWWKGGATYGDAKLAAAAMKGARK